MCRDTSSREAVVNDDIEEVGIDYRRDLIVIRTAP